MTHRERVLLALSRKEPDRVPFTMDFTPEIYERFKRETGAEDYYEYFKIDIRYTGPDSTKKTADFTPYIGRSAHPERRRVDEWGIGWEKGSLHHFEDMVHPLRNMTSIKELEQYPWPDVDADYRWQNVPRQVKTLQAQGYPVIVGIPCAGGTLFETAWYMRGMENLLSDMLINEEFAAWIFDRLTDMAVRNAERIAKAGADIMLTGDDIGTQRAMLMSPELWRKWLKPRMAKIIKTARDIKPDIHVFYHSDGNIEPVIPELIEIGIDVLNPVQPECMDPEKIKEQYGDRLSFWGTIGTQTTMPFGTPEDVRNEVKLRMETVGKGGGLLLAPTHVLEPDVPWENILAFVDAIERFGRYGVRS